MPSPAFLVVGTPRSGTTLVQRLLTEIPGVAMPPETHFFTDLVRKDLAGRTPPLAEEELADILGAYASKPYFAGVDFDVAGVVERVGGRVDTLGPLFAAVCEVLAEGAPVIGEKTPGHLQWWEPLARVMPWLRLVAVVRDPRAVASSYKSLGWGGGPAMTALRWQADVDRISAARRALGSRIHVVRFEDVVADEQSTRARLAAFLGLAAKADSAVAVAEADPAAAPGLRVAAAQPWMTRAYESADPARAEAWRTELPAVDAEAVAALAAAGMHSLGYAGGRRTLKGLSAVPPSIHFRRMVNARRRGMRNDQIRALSRTWLGPDS